MPTSPRRFKDEIYEQISRISKAASAPKRLELLDLLAQGPRTVDVLAHLAAITVGNASPHLKILRAARLVDANRRGLYVEYRLADVAVAEFFVAMRSLASARHAEVERVARDDFEQRGQLAAGMNLGQVGTLAAIHPTTWGMGQLFTGAWPGRIGRKWLIAGGMWVQAVGIVVIVLADTFAGFATGGALLAGLGADALGLAAALWVVAGITFASGVVVALRLSETLPRGTPAARPLTGNRVSP